MVKKTKYPDKDLTDEDKELVQQVAFRYAAKFYALTEKYSNPKKYAEKFILKKLQSDKNLAFLYTTSYVMNSPSGHLFKPREINRKLANDIRNTIPELYKNITIELQDNKNYDKRFLNPRDLKEGVLQKLEKDHIFMNIQGKERIRRLQPKEHRPGKKPTSDDQAHNDLVGKPSNYIMTKEVERLKKALKKPIAIDFLYKLIIQSGLAHKLAKFIVLAFLHAAKIDETALHKLMGVGAFFAQDNIKEEDTTCFKLIYQALQITDDNQLEQYADNIAKDLIDNRGYYALLSVAGLLKL